MTKRAYPAWVLRPKDGMQTLVYDVWLDGVFHFVWLTVELAWLRDTASINDLKSMAIAQAEAVNPI